MLFQEQVFVFTAQCHDLGHVDLIVGGQHGGGVLRFFQAARDGLAQARHLHAFFARCLIGSHRCTRWCGLNDGGGWGCQCFQNIFFHHAAIFAGALHVRKVVFCHQLFRGWGIFDVFGCRCRCLRCCWCGGGCGGRWACCAVCGHDGQFAACFYGCAFFGHDLRHHTRGGCRDFDADFVGFKFTQHFVGFKRFARFFEPCGHGRFRHGFAQCWNHDVHFGSS